MTRVAVGRDIESASLLNFGGSSQGTATTAPTATTFTTDGQNVFATAAAGQLVCTANRIGIIQSVTNATPSVITIDRWYDPAALPANVNAGAASTPAAGAWIIPPGNCPGAYMGLTATATVAVDGDTLLTGEINTAGASGLDRQLATYAHTAAGTTATLTKTFTAAAADTLPVTVAQMGVFQGVVVAATRMIFRTVLNATAAFSLVGDQAQVTDTVTL